MRGQRNRARQSTSYAGPSPVLLPARGGGHQPPELENGRNAADSTANPGAQFFNDATGEPLEAIDLFAGAVIDPDKGVVIATDMKTPQCEKIDLVNMGRWPQGVFHRFDYAFWFNNLTANVGQRIAAYLANRQ